VGGDKRGGGGTKLPHQPSFAVPKNAGRKQRGDRTSTNASLATANAESREKDGGRTRRVGCNDDRDGNKKTTAQRKGAEGKGREKTAGVPNHGRTHHR